MMLPLTGVAGAVDDRDIAGKNAGAGHALALDADGEGGGRMLDQQLVEIERPVDVVLGRRRKSRGGRPGHHRHAQRRAALDIDKGGDVARRFFAAANCAGQIGERHRQTHHFGRRSGTTPRPCPAAAMLLSCDHIASIECCYNIQYCRMNVQQIRGMLPPWRRRMASLCSRYVWPRPPLLRRQRDQTRFLDPARTPDAEFSAKLERRADRSAARRALLQTPSCGVMLLREVVLRASAPT